MEPPEHERRLPSEIERQLERPLTPEERERLLATLDAQRPSRGPTQPEPRWRAALRRLWAFLIAAAGALVALAGPFVGALGAAACWGLGSVYDSNLLRAIAYFGFFLNLINLLPFWILDGSHVADVVNPLVLLVGALGLAAVAWRSHNF